MAADSDTITASVMSCNEAVFGRMVGRLLSPESWESSWLEWEAAVLSGGSESVTRTGFKEVV